MPRDVPEVVLLRSERQVSNRLASRTCWGNKGALSHLRGQNEANNLAVSLAFAPPMASVTDIRHTNTKTTFVIDISKPFV